MELLLVALLTPVALGLGALALAALEQGLAAPGPDDRRPVGPRRRGDPAARTDRRQAGPAGRPRPAGDRGELPAPVRAQPAVVDTAGGGLPDGTGQDAVVGLVVGAVDDGTHRRGTAHSCEERRRGRLRSGRAGEGRRGHGRLLGRGAGRVAARRRR